MHAVRCPACRARFTVPDADLGRLVSCPDCYQEFAAPEDPAAGGPGADGWSPALLGLALLPWGIPFVWLAALVLTGATPIFTFATPVALAVGLCGLALGLGASAGWSHAARVRAILALVVLGYAVAGGLYSVKREWAEAFRKRMGRDAPAWKEFGPGAEPPYHVRMPGPPKPADSPLPGWELVAFRVSEDKIGATDTFVAAHGKPPAGLPADPKAWAERVKTLLTEATGGVVVADDEVVGPVGHTARQFVLSLPDGTPRIVRVIRGRTASYYLSAEGAFFTPDSRDVKTFFRSFRVTGR